MNRRLFKIAALIAILAMISLSCKKNDENDNNSSDNPYNGRTTAVFNPNITYGKMTDQDGNVYRTVTIGTQTWMAENLRTTKYNDSTLIPIVTNNFSWAALSTGAYCNYNNTNNIDTIATFGRLYNWYAVNTGNLAPKGWHVPTDAEWTQLTDYLGGVAGTGDKLKETGTTHWQSPNTGATNEIGFTALPSGFRHDYGVFANLGKEGIWWSVTEYIYSGGAWGRGVRYDYSFVHCDFGYIEMGLSVRCVKD